MAIINLAHLEDLLYAFNSNSEKVQDAIAFLRSDLNTQNWQKHSNVNTNEEPYLKDLPFPRLEMRLIIEEERKGYIYGIVYKHYSETKDNLFDFIPISYGESSDYTLDKVKTTIEEYPSKWIRALMPYRDGFHILSEMKVFNMRAFFVIPSLQKVGEIEYNPDQLNENVLPRMIKK